MACREIVPQRQSSAPRGMFSVRVPGAVDRHGRRKFSQGNFGVAQRTPGNSGRASLPSNAEEAAGLEPSSLEPDTVDRIRNGSLGEQPVNEWCTRQRSHGSQRIECCTSTSRPSVSSFPKETSTVRQSSAFGFRRPCGVSTAYRPRFDATHSSVSGTSCSDLK